MRIVFILFLPHSAPSWILSLAENLASSNLQDGATKWHYYPNSYHIACATDPPHSLRNRPTHHIACATNPSHRISGYKHLWSCTVSPPYYEHVSTFMCGVPTLLWTSEHIFMCGVPNLFWTSEHIFMPVSPPYFEHRNTFSCEVSPPYYEILNIFHVWCP